ncbi:glycosyltransferase family 2 protein [Legionella micdadei]|uniref:Dolichol-phosphate mannosyltransferase n=1 Tax=Legionella micdadei TaxID=451 RepID=A0A098GDC6_LEGMI|nr:glycosyltransferase family 2 protein [Legionella micdadei]ARG97905.1 dolichol-phosphate mannosyltransferase [Legionella micdadei]ARG99774.1 dolichol-phosphate mannosyltransferase [Legionella micdadei]KTD28628.1 glycosyl transferase, group 2 family protein [Legionella micdadei]NSL19283.1 glycosyltransferase family 2 protein [Legionella micdadei]CEG60479.1 Glycosyl transferase family 2 [Legionella micdadei]
MSSNQLREVSIIIPVYNEVDNVEALYQEIVAALPADRFVYEVIFVDDGSTDGTIAQLKMLSQRHINLHVVYHKRNYGQSAALLSGARAARYSMLVTLDGDGQNDPADIPRLFEQLQDSNTVVLGNRKKRDDNSLRKLSSLIGNSVRRRLLNDECPDTGCSLKLFPRDAFLALPHFNHLHRFLPALFKRAGFKLINLPVNHRPRRHGVSKYGVMNRLFVGIHDLMGVRWLLKRPCAPEVTTNEQ